MKQQRNGWADGPAYITQCPIKTGNSYTYDITVTGQRGTLWWHAHILWLRATVYGAFVIMPKLGTPFPFPQPYLEANIVLGSSFPSLFLFFFFFEKVEENKLKSDVKGLFGGYWPFDSLLENDVYFLKSFPFSVVYYSNLSSPILKVKFKPNLKRTKTYY